MLEGLTPFVKGLGTGYGLIIAIGAQNVFVLSQGLKNHYPITVAAICSVIDALLIIVGVAGMGALISGDQRLLTLAAWGGALFLAVYGLLALRRALRPQALQADADQQRSSLQTVVMTALAVSLLNPHVYLDTVVLLGSIGGQYPQSGKIWFATGAVLASLSWFFCLSLGAKWLAPILNKPLAWRILDGIICLIMWIIAVSLLRSV